MSPQVNTEDLVDSAGVAEILTLGSRSSVSVYQKRFPDMPRPVIDLGHGRTRLWSRKAMLAWAKKSGHLRTK